MGRRSAPDRVPRVLVLFGTTEGHSAKVAARAGETVRDEGLAVDVVDAADTRPDPDAYDGALVIASVHAGDYQEPVLDWVRRHARTLNQRPAAFVTVCLGILQDDPKVRADLDAIRERFLERSGWTPGASTAVAGALKYSRYSLLQRLMMKRIARQAGGDTDTRRDYEYTDWAALARFVRGFVRQLRPAAPRIKPKPRVRP